MSRIIDDLLCKDEVYAIVGAAIEVHREMGPGFLGPVYQECLEMELTFREIENESQKPLHIYYKGRRLKKEYIPDFICFGMIIVEIKALDNLSGHEMAQVINYLKATGMRVGVFINFGSQGKLEWKRLVN